MGKAMKNGTLLPTKWKERIREVYAKLTQDSPIPYRRLTAEEIKTEYPPDKVADLIRRAQQNKRWTYDDDQTKDMY